MFLSLHVTALHFSVHDSVVLIIFIPSTSFVFNTVVKRNNRANGYPNGK